MFKKDIPNYKTYSNDTYYMTKAPNNWDFWEEIEAYAIRAESIKRAVNRLNNLALIPPTGNWGYDWLVNDIKDAIRKIRRKSEEGDFPLLMDTIAAITEESEIDIDDINDFLNRHRMGYELSLDGFNRTLFWSAQNNNDDLVERIDNTIKTAEKSELQQAVEHLEQAKKQLEDSSNERARKNAVRDCASAMESIIKILGEDNDIKQATQKLRKSNLWGLDDIVKDGDAIFNKLHYLYPDFRHGSTETSKMSLNEARYWIDRITVYIDYMLRQQDIFDF